MHFRKIDDSPQTFILVFQTGDELAEGLLRFAQEQKLSAASFKAIGALSSVRLGWLSWERKRYEPSVTLDEQVELVSYAVASYHCRITLHSRGGLAAWRGDNNLPQSGATAYQPLFLRKFSKALDTRCSDSVILGTLGRARGRI